MEKNKTEIIAQIVALLSQLVESGDEKRRMSLRRFLPQLRLRC